jgi:mono/diheme cytochrome c family protein
MNYPVWELGALGGGFWIALVAITHVFVSHFAVGGGLWLVLTEHKARRDRDAALLGYVKGHAKFFLLLTMVFGGLSGVGIWWTIALLNPAATSSLIHTFVFGWATEWVCFVGEIVALLIYWYRFDTMRPRDHLIIGWFYFAFAWLSLVLINGIIGYMLTPGRWLETGSFWHGFFNESYWPSLVFRTALSLMIAGIFGLLTGSWQRDTGLRERVVRHSARWLVAPFAVMALAAFWYLKALPEPQESMVLQRAHEVAPWLRRFLWLSPLLLLGGLLAVVRMPRRAQQAVAVALAVIGLAQLGSFEFIREAGRRPWVIHGFMYANAVTAAQAEQLAGRSFLANARWAGHREVTDANRLAAGAEIFRLQCSSCHSVGGPLNDIVPLSAAFTQAGLEAQLSGQGRVVPYMPPFLGDAAERQAVAAYLLQTVHGREPERAAPAAGRELALEIPPFDPAGDSHVLLAWNDLGMHCLTDGDPWWVILPPANTLQAQLIARGETPDLVTAGVSLRYTVEPGFEDPQDEVRFWDFARANFGLEEDLAPGRGLSGTPISGTMTLDVDRELFVADKVPLVPYREGEFEPYPLYTIEARDEATGEVLARTRMVAPVSTEIGCTRCHGGGWRTGDGVGASDETARRVLAVHDKHSGTELLARAEQGGPLLCGSCHADAALGTAGRPELLNMSAAIHGWHANYMSGRGADACMLCHPADPAGQTACLRGAHARSLDCTRCHGSLEDHALALLAAEQEAGKPGAARLMAGLEARAVATVAEIEGRSPWFQQPDCLACHTDAYTRPDPASASAFNRWTESREELYRLRTDETGRLRCAACHGAPHAIYPTRNTRRGADRDNIQPLQYQGSRRAIGAGAHCEVCHGMAMEFSVHHEGMEEQAP